MKLTLVGEVLPDSRHTADLRPAAQLALGADLAGDPGHLVGEGGELLDHRVHGELSVPAARRSPRPSPYGSGRRAPPPWSPGRCPRTWAVSRDAHRVDRLGHVPPTPRQAGPPWRGRRAAPPCRPRRATRVTSPVNRESWSTILLTARPNRRKSPRNWRFPSCRSTLWVRSPPATASRTARRVSRRGRRGRRAAGSRPLTRVVQLPWPGLAEKTLVEPPMPDQLPAGTRCTSELKWELRSMIWLNMVLRSATSPCPVSGTLLKSPSRAGGHRGEQRTQIRCSNLSVFEHMHTTVLTHGGPTSVTRRLWGVASLSLCPHRLRRNVRNCSGSCTVGAIPTQRESKARGPDAPAHHRSGQRATAHTSLPGTPLAPGAARRFVRGALADWVETRPCPSPRSSTTG